MDIRALIQIGLLTAGIIVGNHGLAAEEVAPLPGLDECEAAAVQERQGVLWGWKELGTAVYKISVITPDGKIADAECSSSKPSGLQFENRFGQRRYEPYQRIKVAEPTARGVAPLIFAGKVRITGMEIDTDIKGDLRYEYSIQLPTGHTATAQVNTVTGLLNHAEIKE
jgi:hypothetical protein